MELPNPLLQVIDRFAAKKSDTERLAKGLATRQNTVENSIAMIRSTDPGILAYLWIAVEQSNNMLLLCERDSNPVQIIDLLSSFVPSFHVVQEMGHPEKLLDSRPNFIIATESGSLKLKRQLAVAQRIIPDRILMRSFANGCIGEIFSLSIFGISFVAALNGDFYNQPIIKRLQSREFKVRKEAINSIDLSVLVDHEGPTNTIKGITEYSWMERGEIRVKPNEMVAKNHRSMKIMEGKNLDTNNITKSKIIGKYAESNLIGIKSAMEELQRRVEFLKAMDLEDISGKNPDFMEYYYEIK